MDVSPSRVASQLRTLMELSAVVNSSLSSTEIRKHAVEAATALLGAERGSLLIVDEGTGELLFEVALGDANDTLKEVRLARGQGIAGWVAENCQGVIVHDTHSDERFFSKADAVSDFVTRNMVCVPVCSKGRVLGVLQVMNRIDGPFSEDDKDLLSVFADQVAVAIENANLYQDLKSTFFETAAALADVIEKRDPYTGGHTRRVMTYSVKLAHAIGLSDEEVELVQLAAILHDIGKVGVPDDVLRKPGRLEGEELAAMQGHAEISADILRHVSKLSSIVPAVRSHHERLDGGGYPDGLHEADIPLHARIIAVADTFDAMTSNRPYRNALPVEVAMEELQKCCGTQFDPEMVRVFIGLVESGEVSQAQAEAGDRAIVN